MDNDLCAHIGAWLVSSTGFMSVCGCTPAACACSAFARPMSPPSAVTALFNAMFCGLNGATRTPRRRSTRQSPATSVLLPAPDVVPCTINVPAIRYCSMLRLFRFLDAMHHDMIELREPHCNGDRLRRKNIGRLDDLILKYRPRSKVEQGRVRDFLKPITNLQAVRQLPLRYRALSFSEAVQC